MYLNRRDVFRVVLATGVAAASVAARPDSAVEGTAANRGKRRSQYRADSPEVQTFYRVNSYPKK